MKLDAAGLKAKMDSAWYDFRDGARLRIKPYPRSKTRFVMQDGAAIFSGLDSLETFKFCLLEWEGVVDQDGKPIPLTDDLKIDLFNSGALGVSDFVIRKNVELLNAFGVEQKN